MTIRVVVLRSAEADLHELKNYLIKKFGKNSWRDSYAGIKAAIARIGTYPSAGKIPDELSALNLMQYRQVISGMNRIIYECRQDTVFVHIICDTRKDLRTLLMSRILRTS